MSCRIFRSRKLLEIAFQFLHFENGLADQNVTVVRMIFETCPTMAGDG